VANLSDNPQRGWGEPVPPPQVWLEARTIPTRVGRTRLLATGHSPVSGPSQRGWGQRAQGWNPQDRDRTIPTRVGRTQCYSPASSVTPDHPHAGGENPYDLAVLPQTDGPSPRGWGEHGQVVGFEGPIRTIPTRVGRTCGRGRGRRWRSDHPHAGGENIGQALGGGSGAGPSPRGWGERRAGILYARWHRTIPTRVGRTARRRVARPGIADHPHAGGENPSGPSSPTPSPGPSPRGWGELLTGKRVHHVFRTIPTRVGRTRQVVRTSHQCADHPHAGGENGPG